MAPAKTVLAQLRRRRQTLAAAESFTGGQLMDSLTNVPGSSRAFLGGIVAYDDRAKRSQLHVRATLIRRHGAVSEPVALAMAEGARRAFRARWSVATTGIAGPTGARPGKPVGLSIVAVATKGRSWVERRILRGSRARVKAAAVRQALGLLARAVAHKR